MEPIKIGVLYPTSGSGAVYGTSAMLGHDMAVEEINAMGGIGGKTPIVTVARDTKLKPAAASAAAKELITKEGVDVLMGGLSAAVGLAISEVARREKVIYIATIPKAIHMTTSKLHPYVFRTAPNTDIEGRGIARTIGQLGAKKLCQIQFDYAYGHDLAAGIAKALPQEAAGAEIVLDLKVKLGATDYNTYIAQIMGAGCEGVVSGLWGAAFITFAQQAQPFGFFEQIKYVSGGEIASHEIASKMKGNYPDNVWSNAYELWYHDASPLHKRYQQELARRQGRPDTDGWPILSYIGVKFIEAAVVKAESVDTQALIAALEGLSIETPVGRRTIDAKTHQANTGQFWGPMKKTDEHEFRIMDPVTYISGD
ncbi:MAG: ABC transporter substrate-binding protein [Gemmatimonadetes bacterium]|nr:ABC transporter substrate-binding protein [Gemmatimonadota bacterium]